ncbi:MAG: lysophospholipid acyltransferase family protein [Limisphaerales bacterium]
MNATTLTAGTFQRRETEHSRIPVVAPPRSRALLRWFTTYSAMYLRRHFDGLYLSGPRPDFAEMPGPIVVYLNHASWWDPLICLQLSHRFTSERANFAPIDAKSLEQFRFFRKLGFFPVEKHSRRGALQFLETSASILRDAQSVLWVTPQGDFFDSRVRPTTLKSGIGQLPSMVPNLTFVPLALDYFFGDGRLPSIAARFGATLTVSDFPLYHRHDWTSALGAALENTQDALCEEVTTKRVQSSQPLLAGKHGTGGIYGWWQSMRGRKC